MTVGDANYGPAAHYDRVTAAWGLLLGEELHYGVFEDGETDLATATRRLTDLMLEAGQIEKGQRVLDVGCGTGAPACHIAQVTGAQVMGISTSETGVQASRQRALTQGLDGQVTFEVRDGMANGFPTDCFDRVWALESSHLMRDRKRLIEEVARVLKPGGLLVMCDIVFNRSMDLREVKQLLTPLSLLREVFGDARMEPVAEYVRLAEDAGLQVGVTTDLTEATRPTFDRWRVNARTHQAAVVDLTDEEYWEKFLRACDVLEEFWNDGTLGYGLITASAG